MTREVAMSDFESWLVAREPALQRTAHLLTGDPHTAQDLVQTTLALRRHARGGVAVRRHSAAALRTQLPHALTEEDR